MRKVILFLTTFWVVIYSNSRMLEFVPTYKYVHIFPVPQAMRMLELLLITFLYVTALTTRMTKSILLINLCILTYLALSLSNLLLTWNLSFSAIQDIYVRIVPFLFFVVVAQGEPATQFELRFIIKFFAVVLTLNVLIAVFYQIPFYGYYEDNMNGFFEDAHMFGNYLAVFSIVLFYDFLKTKRGVHLLLSIGLLYLSTFPRNEKVIALNTLIIIVLVIYNWIKRSRTLFRRLSVIAVLVTIFFTGVVYIQKAKGDELWRRADIVVNTIGIENIGPILAWPTAFNEISKSPLFLFWGVGAGEYGWIAASRNVAEGRGSVHSNQFEFEFSNDNTNNAGFLFRTNTWSSLLAEYGIVGFVAFLLGLGFILKRVSSYLPANRMEENLKIAFFALLVIVVYQGFFTPYSNWSASPLLFPMMYIAASLRRTSLEIMNLENVNKDSTVVH